MGPDRIASLARSAVHLGIWGIKEKTSACISPDDDRELEKVLTYFSLSGFDMARQNQY